MIVPSVAGLLWKPPAVPTPTRAPFKLASWTDIALLGALDASSPGAAAAVETASDNPGVGAGAAMAGVANASDAVARAAPISIIDFFTISSSKRSRFYGFSCLNSYMLLNPLSLRKALLSASHHRDTGLASWMSMPTRSGSGSGRPDGPLGYTRRRVGSHSLPKRR